MASYFDEVADVGSEEDEDFEGDEEGQERRRANGGDVDDSSEEDEEDDEDALAAVQQGFIEDEDDEDDDPESRKRRRAERKKRKREEREEEDNLEDDDLDLVAENNPDYAPPTTVKGPKFGRLVRRGERVAAAAAPQGDDFWSEEEGEPRRGAEDEMAGFIEEDFPDQEEGGDLDDDDIGVKRMPAGGFQALKASANLDADALEDFNAAFGDGTDYDWALALQEQEDYRRATNDDGEDAFKPMELKDVFEPSELERKYLTDADHEIRGRDEPERFQIGRKPYRNLELTEDQVKEEGVWIAKLLWPHAKLESSLLVPYQQAIIKVLHLFNVEELEVPFVYRHRKDYLVHEPDATQQISRPDGQESKAIRLLTESDLWEIFQQDLKFRAFIERRNGLESAFNGMKQSNPSFTDSVFEEMLSTAETVDELQDLQDYLHFQYPPRSTDANGPATNGTKSMRRRPGVARVAFDKIRNSNVYMLVRAFGITAHAFAKNALGVVAGESMAAKQYTEDPSELPEIMAQSDQIRNSADYSTGPQCMRAARQMFAEELATSPPLRRVFRRKWYADMVFDCMRTEKGLRKIDDHHPFYEFKYLRNQTLRTTAESPGLFLRMLQAESEGLVEIQCRLDDAEHFKKALIQEIESDNLSDVADAWNKERREALSIAFDKLNKIMARGVKENLRYICESQVLLRCRDAYYDKLDQAPWRPKGEEPGTLARILAISNGNGIVGRDPLTYVVVDDDGKMIESARLVDLSLGVRDRDIPDGNDVSKLMEIVANHNPDVIAISGYSTETQKLVRQVQKLIQEKNVEGPEYTVEDGEGDRRDLLDVVVVNDEVARLYKDSDRAAVEYPALTSLGRYCVALARYMQSPILEYASLGRDIISINFDQDQRYVSEGRLLNSLETAIVDVVNMVGVDINEAASSQYHSALVPYVSALGPRKAQHVLKCVRTNGGYVVNRQHLVFNPEAPEALAPVGGKTYTNCASFLKVVWDPDNDDNETDFLDATRIHPEDYLLARKMAADALELDEEDVEQEVNEHGDGAVVKKLVRDGHADKIEDLDLQGYAEQLWKVLRSRKQAALQTIKSEMVNPYEELRRTFDDRLSSSMIFTMFTGETEDSLTVGMVVPMYIRRVSEDSIEGRLDCGLDALVEIGNISSSGMPPRQLFSPTQTARGKILDLDRKKMLARLSLLEQDVSDPVKNNFGWVESAWDSNQEKEDKSANQAKHDAVGRTQRVIKHPLFRPFNSSQAEEYLAGQIVGSVVIRPSSKGSDHLVVTWKVADGVHKHIDVLELDKENEFSLGRILKIDGRYSYSDLDELIVNHVNAMAKKVDEIMAAEKFQRGSKADTDRWLTTYLEANPKRSTYAFCINTKAPGYFHLCFKESQSQPVRDWPVKIIPGAFVLQGNPYQDMRQLANGFKLMYAQMQKEQRKPRH